MAGINEVDQQPHMLSGDRVRTRITTFVHDATGGVSQNTYVDAEVGYRHALVAITVSNKHASQTGKFVVTSGSTPILGYIEVPPGETIDIISNSDVGPLGVVASDAALRGAAIGGSGGILAVTYISKTFKDA